jgi:predicted amidohydrolase YtcJ
MSTIWVMAQCTAVAAGNPVPADLVVTDARVYTADSSRSMAEAVAVRDGKIVYVGDAKGAGEFIGPATEVRKLAGRLVLPGLIDSHVHPMFTVDHGGCDLQNAARSLQEIAAIVRECIRRDALPPGTWVNVMQWNYSNGNVPSPGYATLRQALDRASTDHPIQLYGSDGHHGAFNSLALAGARNAAGTIVGYSKATLDEDFPQLRALIGVDEAGEPNGTANDNARSTMDAPSLVAVEYEKTMKAPERVPQLLNSVGITGILDAAVAPELLPFYDTLKERGQLTFRASLAQYYDPDEIRTAQGQPDYARMVATAREVRQKYSGDPLLRADVIKLFADGTLEGNPFATPPTLPGSPALNPYLQPVFKRGPDGKLAVVAYVDTASEVCRQVRAAPDRYSTAAAATDFMKAHGYHPGQCQVASGQYQHDRGVILEFVRQFHLAGFALHIHAIGDAAVRTAVDAIEAARAADGIATQHDALAHIQVASPEDVKRIGRDRLYLAFTYSWNYADPEYDLSVVPFFDRVSGGNDVALHPRNGYYEQNAYPTRTIADAGATLIAGSDAPVFTRDPQPFVNMAMAVTRRLPGRVAALNPQQAISIREVVDAYTINGARYLNRDREAGSLEVGKSADFIVVDQDILALADRGNADVIAQTKVLETWFRGISVYARAAAPAASQSKSP